MNKTRKNLSVEEIAIDLLKPHPQNYRQHPQDQIEHLKRSIEEHGFYRNIVIADDNIILAGHGAVIAARELGFKTVPIVRVGVKSDSKKALKLMMGDNEIEHLAEQDDRLLSELLKLINDTDETDLLGTGFDEQMLANLLYVTRPKSEIATFNEAAHWVGLTDYDNEIDHDHLKIIVRFRNEDDLREFSKLVDSTVTLATKSIWYPALERTDYQNVKFEQEDD